VHACVVRSTSSSSSAVLARLAALLSIMFWRPSKTSAGIKQNNRALAAFFSSRGASAVDW
jgi:hypothetical protein